MKTLDQQLLAETIRRIVAALQPEAIYLYGSHAYGSPHEDSDVDLLIVISDSTALLHQKTVEAYRALRMLFLPVEIKIITRTEFVRRSLWLSSIERVVSEKGKKLYDARAG